MQMEPVLGEFRTNFEKIDEFVKRAGQADLLVFPELALSGYALKDKETARKLAITATGEEMGRLVTMARAAGTHLVVGLAERVEERVYNSAALIGPLGLKGIYRKTHLFGNEQDLFEPGDTGFSVFDVGGVQVGIMICFDWVFPESAGTLARKGAEVIAHPSNLVLPYASLVMPSRCLENRVFAVTANRIGEEPTAEGSLRFRGRSAIISPKGEILMQASPDEEVVTVFDIDPLLARDKKLTPRNHLFEDRRPLFYE